MCVVSMIGDCYTDQFPWRYPQAVPQPVLAPADWTDWTEIFKNLSANVSRKEFDDLKKEVEQLRDLLKKAQEFDKATNQPSCDNHDKLALIRGLAQALGVDLSDLKLNE